MKRLHCRRPPLRIPAALALAAALGGAPCEGQILSHVAAYFDGDTQGMTTLDGLGFPFAAAVSPDGKHVYGCSGNGGLTNSDNALTAFARDLSTGELTFVEAEFDDDDPTSPGTADGLFTCRDVVVSPDGKHVYTAGFSDGAVGLFTRDAGTGAVTFVSIVQDGSGGVDGLAGVEALAMTPDGSALFAVGSIDDALVAFSRDATTGALTFQQAVFDGVGVGNALDRPLDVAVSPDGLHVYTAAGSNSNFSGSDAVAAFSWSSLTHTLTFLDSYTEGETQNLETIDGLDRVSSVTVSPDGKHVYATGGLDIVDPTDLDWIAIFSRSAATGELTWLQAIDDFNFCDFDVLFEFETWAVVAPDDRVYVTSPRTALAAFERDTTTGGLTLINASCFFDDLGTVDTGINLPRKLAIDPVDRRHVYVPGNASDALSVFRVCNPALDGSDVALPDQDVTTVKTELACDSLSAADYNVLAGGDVLFISPVIVLGEGFDVAGGLFTAVNP